MPNPLAGKADSATRTRQTVEFYLSTAKGLLERYARDTGRDWRDDPLSVVAWMTTLKPELSRSSWRSYKAAMSEFMRRHGPREAVDLLAAQGPDGCLKRGRTGPSKKAKSLPADDLRQVVSLLQQERRTYDRLLSYWFLFGRLLGLRPGEWARARLEGRTLIVANAKHTNGRGLGPERRLDLSAMTEPSLSALREFLSLLGRAVEKSEFKTVYTACRVRLQRVTKRLWPNRQLRPSLYSGRHQLTADLKAERRPLEEIAAILGQASDATASRHYGRKARGEGRAFVQVGEEAVAQVRRKHDGSFRRELRGKASQDK